MYIQPRLNKFVLLYLKPITQVRELLLGHVGIFLDSSGSQLSFEHKHKTILPKNCWENCIGSWVPYCKRKANELWVHFTLYSIILAYPTKELLNLIQFWNFVKFPFLTVLALDFIYLFIRMHYWNCYKSENLNPFWLYQIQHFRLIFM